MRRREEPGGLCESATEPDGPQFVYGVGVVWKESDAREVGDGEIAMNAGDRDQEASVRVALQSLPDPLDVRCIVCLEGRRVALRDTRLCAQKRRVPSLSALRPVRLQVETVAGIAFTHTTDTHLIYFGFVF